MIGLGYVLAGMQLLVFLTGLWIALVRREPGQGALVTLASVAFTPVVVLVTS